MAVEDAWHKRDGIRSGRYGRGKRWRVRWQGETRSFTTKADAEDYWFQVRTRPRRPAATSDVTVGGLLDRWLDSKRGLSPRGFRACQDAAVHVRPVWGRSPAAEISRVAVQSWIGALQVEGGPASASLRHKLLQCLSGGLAVAVEDGTISANPCAGVKVGAQRRRDPRFLSIDELRGLATECDGFESMVWFLGTTGLRIGEACAANVGDVNRKRRRIWVRAAGAKSRQGRDVPIPASVLGMLDLSRPKAAPLFTSSRGARVLKDNWRARHFSPAVLRAGLDGLTIHDLRHTAASLAIMSGADVKAVQAMLGHASATMTLDLYAHLWDRGLDEVGGRMDGLIVPGT